MLVFGRGNFVEGALQARRQADENERSRVAFHESGHALLPCLLLHTDPLERVGTIPRGC